MEEKSVNEILTEEALKEVPLHLRVGKGQLNDFLDQLVRTFIVKKIEDFPRLCMETRKINNLHNQELEQHSYKTSTRMVGGEVVNGTSGWSKDKTFKHKWVIPMDLKVFMRNCIYVNFWDDDNWKVRDSFMRAILRGDDPLTLLAKVRAYYGSNHN